MIYAFLDTSKSKNYFFAIIKDNKIYRFNLYKNDPSAFLASFVRDALLNLKLNIKDIKKFFIFLGVGSYQGLKNGLAFCQGLCHQNKNLFGIRVFDFLDKNSLIILKSWKSNEYTYAYKNQYYLEAQSYENIINKFNKNISIITDDVNIKNSTYIKDQFYHEDTYLLDLDKYYLKCKLEPIYNHSFSCYLLKF
jgi:tRNA A37 threonylcarbamoyladenosine modification protein TsaB